MKPQNKKDLIAAYKQRVQIGGIYAVTPTRQLRLTIASRTSSAFRSILMGSSMVWLLLRNTPSACARF